MRIRLGAPVFKAENADRIPNNYGMEDHANKELDYVVDSANQSYETALKVDGVEFMLWRKTREGRRCTCKYAVNSPTDQDSRFSESNNASGFKKTNPIKVRGSWDRQEVKKNAFGTELGVEIGRINPDDGSGKQETKNYPSIDQDEVTAFLNGPVDGRLLFGGEGATACGICFGTGFTNGYSLYRGTRVTFDALNTSSKKGFMVESSTRPHLFKTSGEQSGQYVEWEWESPAFFKTGLAVLVRDNLSPADNLQILVKEEGGTFIPLTVDSLNNFKGVSKRLTIRVQPHNVNNNKIQFTHLELILQFSPWPQTQVGQLQQTTSFATAEPVSNLEFPIPPSINNISEGDAIFETKYDKVYLISDVTDMQTAKRQVLTWNASGRSMTSFDILSLLKLSRYPQYSVSFTGLDKSE